MSNNLESWEEGGFDFLEEQEAILNTHQLQEENILNEYDVQQLEVIAKAEKEVKKRLQTLADEKQDILKKLMESNYFIHNKDYENENVRIVLTREGVRDLKYYREAEQKHRERLSLLLEEKESFLKDGVVVPKSKQRLQVKLTKSN